MKAIRITKSTVDMLASRYNIESDELDERMPVGYILVTDFGNDDNYDLLTPEVFATKFSWGMGIANGFTEIWPL